MSRRSNDGLVYSSEHGRICPHCGLPTKRCQCRANPRLREQVPDGDGIVRVRRETKGRKGKTVTTLTGILLPESELKQLAKELKRRCGGGGAVKDGVIEIQGDHRDVLVEELERRDFKVKRAGG
ncbi:MAG: translation initiation factor Sui1 [bacterium]|nr:translation initiation factor Sui1 [bacterium]